MSNSAINQGVLSAKISNVQNVGDSSAVCSTTGDWSFKNATATATNVFISNAGNVGIGTTTPLNLKLDVAGNVHTSGSYILDNDNSLYWGFADGSTSIKGNSSTDTLTFSTLGTERMRIDVSGNLLVGKTTASDAVGAGVYVTPAGGIYSTQTGSINYLTCYNTTASAYRFYVTAAGQINATSTSIAAISDASLKENVRDLETGLSQVLALKPRRFDWKEETQIDQKDVAGFIAQEVEEILPELVYEYKYNETETKKSLKMGDMLPTLVKAIQELSAKVDAQAAEIAALKAK